MIPKCPWCDQPMTLVAQRASTYDMWGCAACMVTAFKQKPIPVVIPDATK